MVGVGLCAYGWVRAGEGGGGWVRVVCGLDVGEMCVRCGCGWVWVGVGGCGHGLVWVWCGCGVGEGG